MSTIKRIFSVLLLLFIGVIVGRASTSPKTVPDNLTGEEAFTASPFWETWDQLHKNFIGTLEDNKLSYGAIDGMVRASGDAYTAFSDPETTKQFKDTLKGSFSGIGAEMGVKNGLVVVIAPLEGSPAQKAGVKAGDIIIAVDKKNITEDMSLDEVVRLIRGPKGQTVELKVFHKDADSTTDISIVRDDIAVQSIKSEIKDGILHVSVLNFNGDTAAKFLQVAKDAKRQNITGVIVDVRNNPGGYLDSAVDISSAFMGPGLPVVIERGKRETTHSSSGTGILKGLPVVVLINGSSASASEIVAGALQDNLDAKVIGTKSFGKGSVQEVIDLSDGSSLRVTIAKWFTPKGRSINEHGIEPSIVVEDKEDAPEDEQLMRALEEVKK
ncbi:MAG: S41 family peptidase [bacterium]|nr:S41 family peptidase [bacterium]